MRARARFRPAPPARRAARYRSIVYWYVVEYYLLIEFIYRIQNLFGVLYTIRIDIPGTVHRVPRILDTVHGVQRSFDSLDIAEHISEIVLTDLLTSAAHVAASRLLACRPARGFCSFAEVGHFGIMFGINQSCLEPCLEFSMYFSEGRHFPGSS